MKMFCDLMRVETYRLSALLTSLYLFLENLLTNKELNVLWKHSLLLWPHHHL